MIESSIPAAVETEEHRHLWRVVGFTMPGDGQLAVRDVRNDEDGDRGPTTAKAGETKRRWRR